MSRFSGIQIGIGHTLLALMAAIAIPSAAELCAAPSGGASGDVGKFGLAVAHTRRGAALTIGLGAPSVKNVFIAAHDQSIEFEQPRVRATGVATPSAIHLIIRRH